MTREKIDRPINGAIICEKCLYADNCSQLKPCGSFTLAVGTNFREYETMVVPSSISISEYTFKLSSF